MHKIPSKMSDWHGPKISVIVILECDKETRHRHSVTVRPFFLIDKKLILI